MDFKRKILDNGMTIIHEKRDIPVVSVAFAARAGGINEKTEEKGVSHLIEHMLYKGTKTRDSGMIAEEIEKKGGILNGFTDEEITAFWCKMPSKHLGVALEVLSDVVKNPKFDEEDLEKEKKVIFEEIKMRKDNPAVYVFDKIGSYLYKSPLGIPLIGDEKTVGSLNRKDVVKKFKEIYSPNNLILCVVGDADFEEIVKFAEENFKGTKKNISELEINTKNNSDVEEREGIDQANLIFAYHVPFAGEKGSYTADVLSALMSEGMSSRLFHEIREKRNLAYSIKGGSEIGKRFAFNFVYVGTTKDNVDTVKEIILKEFEKIIEELDENELKQVKEQVIGNHKISMEDSQSQMVHLLIHEIFGNADDFYKFEENVSKIKLEDVKKLAKKAKNTYSFFALVPK